MTAFRVLPVRRGDAYLLHSSRGSYLVDGGGYGNDLPGLIEERRAKKLRAAICSSACSERLGGILELMEAGHAVAEYWLPEGIERVIESACRFNEDWREWAKLFECEKAEINRSDRNRILTSGKPFPVSENRRLHGAAIMIELAWIGIGSTPHLSRISPLFNELSTEENTLGQQFIQMLILLAERATIRRSANTQQVSVLCKQAGWQLLQGSTPEELAMMCGRLLLAEAEILSGGTERGTKAVIQGLALATMAAALLSNTTTRIRSFRHTGQREDFLVPRHPMVCINGKEVDPHSVLPRSITPKAIHQMARQLSAHKEGLVFQYGDIGCSALFCGDSRMMFLDKNDTISLDRPTIITAPRQGNSAADRTYGRITSAFPQEDVWIRSHYSNARKISVYYKNQPNKICLNNCQNLTLQEILLNFSNNQWRTLAGGICACS